MDASASHDQSKESESEIIISNEGSNETSLLRKDVIIKEVKKQMGLGGPLMVINFLLFSLQVISVMFVGHLGQLPLAGASIATSFASVTGISFLVCYYSFFGSLTFITIIY